KLVPEDLRVLLFPDDVAGDPKQECAQVVLARSVLAKDAGIVFKQKKPGFLENVIDFQSRRVAAHLPDRPMEPGTAKFDQILQCSRVAITSHFQQRIVRRLLIPHSGLLSLEWIVRGFCYKGNWSLPKQAFDKLAQPPAILRYETFPSLAVALVHL